MKRGQDPRDFVFDVIHCFAPDGSRRRLVEAILSMRPRWGDDTEYASVLCHVDRDTGAVIGLELVMNKKRMTCLSKRVALFVLIHEALHIVMASLTGGAASGIGRMKGVATRIAERLLKAPPEKSLIDYALYYGTELQVNHSALNAARQILGDPREVEKEVLRAVAETSSDTLSASLSEGMPGSYKDEIRNVSGRDPYSPSHNLLPSIGMVTSITCVLKKKITETHQRHCGLERVPLEIKGLPFGRPTICKTGDGSGEQGAKDCVSGDEKGEEGPTELSQGSGPERSNRDDKRGAEDEGGREKGKSEEDHGDGRETSKNSDITWSKDVLGIIDSINSSVQELSSQGSSSPPAQHSLSDNVARIPDRESKEKRMTIAVVREIRRSVEMISKGEVGEKRLWRPSRRRSGEMKRKVKQEDGRVVMIVDVSGSIGAARVGLSLRTIQAALEALSWSRITTRVIQCNSDVTSDVTINRPDDIKNLSIDSYGGTNMQPALDLAFKDKQAEAILVITDAEFSAVPHVKNSAVVAWIIVPSLHGTANTKGEMNAKTWLEGQRYIVI